MTIHHRDFFKQPFAAPELRGLLGATPAADAFAWNSPRAKSAGLSRGNPPPDDELVRLMVETPHLIRRPVIRIGGRTFFGFKREQLEEALG